MKKYLSGEPGVHTASVNDMMNVLDESQYAQLQQHRDAITAFIQSNQVRLFPGESYTVVEDLERDPLRQLGHSAVRSVNFNHNLFSTTNEVPQSTQQVEVKLFESTDEDVAIRFFNAKSKIGEMVVGGQTVDMKERRYFAAIGHGSDQPRPIDIQSLLGAKERHERDLRSILVAPTMVAMYGVKRQRFRR